MTSRADTALPLPRSAAAQDASRANGAKSRGPKTAAGKRTSARNALRHGLRSTAPVELAALPDWASRIGELLTAALVHIGQARREHLDRYLMHLVLIERADQLIAEEMGRLFAVSHRDDGSVLTMRAGEIDLSNLRALLGYRSRFCATRDRCIVKLAMMGPWKKQLRAAEKRARAEQRAVSVPESAAAA